MGGVVTLEVRRERASGTLEQEGVAVEQFMPELGPAPQELSVANTEALRAADNIVLVRETLRGVAQQYGLSAGNLDDADREQRSIAQLHDALGAALGALEADIVLTEALSLRLARVVATKRLDRDPRRADAQGRGASAHVQELRRAGGRQGTRTPDPLGVNEMLFRLS